MRNFVPLLLLFALIVLGCGKSPEEKKAEADLNDEIMKVHEYSMASLGKIGQLDKSLDSALTQSASLASQHPGPAVDSVTAGLKAGQGALARARASMEDWMQGYRPYDQSVKHDEAMAELSKQKQGLAQATADALAAIDTASSALNRFRQLVESASRKSTGRH